MLSAKHCNSMTSVFMELKYLDLKGELVWPVYVTRIGRYDESNIK